MKTSGLRTLLTYVLIATILAAPLTLYAETSTSTGVKIIWGPTPIMEGEAKGPGDLTIVNEYYAVAFGISTDPPWGIPRGHIVDLAPIDTKTGEITSDVLAQFSFPLNDWANWAKIDLEKGFTIIDETPKRVIVIAIGKWKDLEVNYTYVFESGKRYFTVLVTVKNTGTVEYRSHIMGPAITFETGWTFIPGFGTPTRSTGTRPRTDIGAVDDWVAGYHEWFAVGLYSPGYTHISASSMWVDPFYNVTLKPGESRLFVAYIAVFDSSDLCKAAVTFEMLRGGNYAFLRGTATTTKGEPLKWGLVVAERDGRAYCWSPIIQGLFDFQVPAPGNYSFYAIAKAHAPSTKVAYELKPGDARVLAFADVMPPSKVVVNVFRNDTGRPTDAVILVSSPFIPPAVFLAVTTAYTNPTEIGKAVIDLAPGNYTLQVGWAPGFLSKWVSINLTLRPEEVVELNATIEVLFKPSKLGWYMADLHHHSNYMDGKTPPEYLVVAQSAFGLDFAFVSDHDYWGNCPIVMQYAAMRNMTFICSVEISPDWAHFNIYPLVRPEYLKLRGTLREIIESARAAGALVVRANHPYIGGLFIAQEQNNIPGGYYEGWDVAEINGPWGVDDNRTFTKMMSLWNMGIRKYLTAGSDVHDVWATPRSGFPRVVAYLPGGPSPEALAMAELQGRTFITYGPFIFTDPLPGSTIGVSSLSQNITIRALLFAVEGLSRIEVYSLGRLIRSIPVSPSGVMTTNITIELPASMVIDPTRGFGWVVFIVYDVRGNRAITNPIWIDTRTLPTTETVTKTVTETKVFETTKLITTTSYETLTVTKTEIQVTTKVSTETVVTEKTATILSTTTAVIEVEVARVNTALLVAVGVAALAMGIAISHLIARRKS
ncbi:MAG: CehA/McbA family metallohydrolase [Desulfurococcaceae archaeon]